jgi:hypothetical protein
VHNNGCRSEGIGLVHGEALAAASEVFALIEPNSRLIVDFSARNSIISAIVA